MFVFICLFILFVCCIVGRECRIPAFDYCSIEQNTQIRGRITTNSRRIVSKGKINNNNNNNKAFILMIFLLFRLLICYHSTAEKKEHHLSQQEMI